MERYDEQTYGDRIAEVYDQFFPEVDEAMLDLLEELAGGGDVLELGVGTGRIALPLAERGLNVAGIDASPSMIAKLRQKPGGDAIAVHLGSFRDLPVEGQFSLIFVAFNTLFGLLTQDEQLQCFQSVAGHLAPGGLFLVEAFVPDLCRYERRQKVTTVDVAGDQVRLDVAKLDPVLQQVTSQHILLSEDGVKLFPAKLRYIWPSEMDLMARIAGLKRQHRWGGWHKEQFDGDSDKHVSVYARSGQ